MIQGTIVAASYGREIGTIMSSVEVMMPYLEEKFATSMAKLEACQANLDGVLTASKSNQGAVDLEPGQHEEKLIDNKRSTQQLLSDISILQSRMADLLKVDQTLPEGAFRLEPSRKTVKNAIDSYKSERFEQMTITPDSPHNVETKINAFIRDLGARDLGFEANPINILSDQQRHSIVDSVAKLVAQSQSVLLIGSYVSLGRLRSPDELKVSRLTHQNTGNFSNFYMVIGELLGGLFLGIEPITGRQAGSWPIVPPDVYVISLGAIPRMKSGNDLLSKYHDWKDALVDYPEAGYPILFKVECLTNLLAR